MLSGHGELSTVAVTEMLTWVSDTTVAVKARVGGGPDEDTGKGICDY